MNRLSPDKMSVADLERLGREADSVTYDNTRPLSAEGRKALKQAASKGGRPRIGAGAKRINITIERTLLARVDAFARRSRTTRAAVVAQGLRELIAA